MARTTAAHQRRRLALVEGAHLVLDVPVGDGGALALAQVLPDPVRLVAGTGFLGGYTTFSTATFETVRLVQERRLPAAILNGLGTLVATTALAGLGLVIGLSA